MWSFGKRGSGAMMFSFRGGSWCEIFFYLGEAGCDRWESFARVMKGNYMEGWWGFGLRGVLVDFSPDCIGKI